MKKNIVCALLSLSISATLLSGCGAKSTAPTAATQADTSAVADTSETAKTNDAASGKKQKNRTADNAKADSGTQYEAEAPAYDTGNYLAAEGATADAAAYAESGYYEEYYDPYYGYGYYNTEEYNDITENGFSNAKTSPLSTFAADVDTASYSNFRRMVEQGYSLGYFPEGSIRTEEMVNYFTYDYEEPKKGDIFGVKATISDCPWNDEAKLMVLGINTKTMKKSKMPDSNIVFLIDVSGSMSSSNKLPLIKDSMELLIENFDKNDRISIVTYASGTDVKLNGASGDEEKKILRAFNRLKAGGSTNGGEGLKLAYEVAEENFIEDGVNRVIICSDGDFNVGITSQEELEDLISKEKESGVFLSVLGFGMSNYSDVTMETLADKGNGNYAYIDNLQEAKKVLVDEMTSTFVTVAKDVKLQVEFNPAMVYEYRLVGYENRGLAAEDFKDDSKDGGEMGAGHQVTAIYEIILADDVDYDEDLKYQDTKINKKGNKKDEYCTLSIAYKEPDGDESEYREFPIGEEEYTRHPDEDYIFASLVAEASLALRGSEYLVDVTPEEALEDILSELDDMYDLDEYREEFYDLMEYVSGNSYGYGYDYYYEE
ncbi:MAG: VWA domain-containing protein [Lachnospiraceae bacterium]|nr:VWA domain-containing protein [Lachnospiraceae bacterium]